MSPCPPHWSVAFRALGSPSRTGDGHAWALTPRLCSTGTYSVSAAAVMDAIRAHNTPWGAAGGLKERLRGVDLCAALRLCAGQAPPAPPVAGGSPYFCEHADCQEVWTTESVGALAQYLEGRVQALRAGDRPIVEVCGC